MRQMQPTPLWFEGDFEADYYAIESPTESYDGDRVYYPADAKFLATKRNDV